MGWYKYFSVFKFFWYGLTSRRNRKLLKMLLICIGIAMLIFWLSMNVEVQASTMVDEDVTQSIKYKYDSICVDFLRRYERLSDTYQSGIKNLIIGNNMTNIQYYIYYGQINGSDCLNGGTYLDNDLRFVIYRTSSLDITYSSYTNYFGLTCNHILDLTNLGGGFSYSYVLGKTGQFNSQACNQVFMPSELLNYNSWVIYDYFYGNSTLEEIEAQLETANAKLDAVNDNLEDINDTLSNTTVDDSLITTVTDSTQDITENGVATVFTKFYDALTNYDSGVTGFTVDIMGASFEISSDMIYDLMSGNNLQWLIGIIHSFYWYWACRYCVKDIYRYISKIKDGTIMTSSETNIKEEML